VEEGILVWLLFSGSVVGGGGGRWRRGEVVLFL